jgi:SHS2 domain-containing protein
MPYQYLDDIATADIAFKAWGASLEEMFVAACDATMNVMVEDLDTIERKEERLITVEEESLEILLYQMLQELVYYKDADQVLLRVSEVELQNRPKGVKGLRARAYGERIAPTKHPLGVDIKAVTLHRLNVRQTDGGWEATVVLDI